MTWVRLDGGCPRHPKILAVGPLGAWLYIEALCYAGEAKTDGFIPQAILPQLLLSLASCAVVTGARARGRLRQTVPGDQIDWPARLVAAGLWELVEGGYQIHNYLRRQPPAAYWENLTAVRSEAGKKGAAKRWQIDGNPDGKDMASSHDGKWQNDSTRRNDTRKKPLSFSGSNDETPPSQSPEPASNGQPAAAEAKRKIDELVRRLASKKALPPTPF